MRWTARLKRRWTATRQTVAGVIWWLRYRLATRRRLLKRVSYERRGRLAERRQAAAHHEQATQHWQAMSEKAKADLERVTKKYIDAQIKAERLEDRVKQLEDEQTTADREQARLQGQIDVMEDQLRLLSAWQEKWQQRMEAEAAISATRKVAAELGRVTQEDVD